MTAICCPKCKTAIPAGAEKDDTCPGCGARYRLSEGILDFDPQDDFYWGEISQEAMVGVNRKATQAGWRRAVIEDVLPNDTKNLSTYLLDDVRAAGIFHFYDPDMNDAVVDLGSGWGPISFALSRFYQTVYSIDGVRERLQFQAIRASQEHIDNIKIMKSSMLKLPLKDKSVSVVIVNGLLEWVGLSDSHTHPREVQINFLKEVHRILKPGGKIYIGIENRVGVQYFTGDNIDHSGIRFTNLVPRWLANYMVRRMQRRKESLVFSGAEASYRTLTYTSWGYRKLLKEAGFQNPEVYWAWPSYNEPRVSGTLDGASIRRYLGEVETTLHGKWKRALVRAASKLPDGLLGLLIKIFSPHFLIVANKDRVTSGLQEDLLADKNNKCFLRTTVEINSHLKSSYQLFDKNGSKEEMLIEPIKARVYQVDDRRNTNSSENSAHQVEIR